MALNRYDQRKNYEEEEANAIGTEYLRASLLPAQMQQRCGRCLSLISISASPFTRLWIERLLKIDAQTAKAQSELWTAIQAPACRTATPTVTLAVAGMNDVFNSQGYTQAAWWNRIPNAAWGLMAAIAICSNVLVGYSARRPKEEFALCDSTAGYCHRIFSHRGYR